MQMASTYLRYLPLKVETTDSGNRFSQNRFRKSVQGKNQGYTAQAMPGKTTILFNCGCAILVTQKSGGRFLKSWDAGIYSVNLCSPPRVSRVAADVRDGKYMRVKIAISGAFQYI